MKTSDNDLKVNRNIYPDAVSDEKSTFTASGYIFRLLLGHYPTFSYSDECRTKKAFSISK